MRKRVEEIIPIYMRERESLWRSVIFFVLASEFFFNGENREVSSLLSICEGGAGDGVGAVGVGDDEGKDEEEEEEEEEEGHGEEVEGEEALLVPVDFL